MIGVLCACSERETAAEFFELFKTPWEFYDPNRRYEVVISTRQEIPSVSAALVLIFSSTPTDFDHANAIVTGSALSRKIDAGGGVALPIYGALLKLDGRGAPVVYGACGREVVALSLHPANSQIVRVGYDLFREVAFLLTQGQPAENSMVPTLDAHIALLRGWIVRAGIPLVEIPPVPLGCKLSACLTHDVDFGGLRLQRFDHTLWGFIYRALLGSLLGLLRGTCSLDQLTRNWQAVLTLPLVYLGVIQDPWDDYEQYLEIEHGLRSTFYLIPYKHRAGERVQGPNPGWRATPYDIGDIGPHVALLLERGCEIGLHAIDAWHSVDKGRDERRRIADAIGREDIGVRVHWLCYDWHSPAVLEQAGFEYDASIGCNGTIGYRAGTAQVYQPAGASHLLELPLHIQDTALFYRGRLALSPAQAWDLCRIVLDTTERSGGVVTVSWHQRSLAPERLWDQFYVRLVEDLKARGAWFGTAREVVDWYRQRRSVVFEHASLEGDVLQVRLRQESANAPGQLFLRVHRPHDSKAAELGTEPAHLDVPWNGQAYLEIKLGQIGVG